LGVVADHIPAMNQCHVASDSQLLRGYLQQQDEQAFAELVRRHIGWVYHLAMRQLRDPADAEDATQAVFMLLLRKAGRFRDAQPISPWLFHSTMFMCRDARKSRQRRAIHERKAAAMRSEANRAENSPSEISCQLDEAIDRLRQIDRQTIVLRFFQGLSHEQIAETLGISEDAAKMRLSRAVERLRTYFVRTTSLSAPALEQALAVQGVLAPLPSHLIERVITSGRNGARASTVHLSWLIHWKIAAALLIGGSSLCVGVIAAHLVAGEKTTIATSKPTTQHSPGATIFNSGYFVAGSVQRPGVYLIPGPKMSLRQLILLSGPDPSIGPYTFVFLYHRLSKHTDEICVYRYLPLMMASASSPNVFPLDRKIFLNDMTSISDAPRLNKPIAPGDLLMVAVADSDQPGRSVDLRLTVSSAGSVLIPEAGMIHLAGQTMPQAEKLVRDAYIKANLIASPMISVGRIKSATDK
jgi:RNA polymerase sigma factor (sigma-70 family)